jgi:hypothetical protein
MNAVAIVKGLGQIPRPISKSDAGIRKHASEIRCTQILQSLVQLAYSRVGDVWLRQNGGIDG